MNAPMDPRMRIGDAERERAASQLAEHYAVGRLDREEHSERLDRIWAARTQADLDPVFVDLPGHAQVSSQPSAPRSTPSLPPWQQATQRTGPPRRAGRRFGTGIPAPLLVALVLFGIVAVVTNFPLILIGIGVWFFFLRGGCGSRQWSHPRR